MSIKTATNMTCQRLVAGEAKVQSLTTTGSTTTTVGLGAKNGSTLTSTEYGNDVIHRTRLTFLATPITITDVGGTIQYGGVKVYDFPQGLLCFMGAVVTGNITGGVTGTIIDTWTGSIALGSVTAAGDNDLTATEANFLKKTAVTQAAAKVAAVDAVSLCTATTETVAQWIDGTATAVDLFLNLIVTDDATHTSGTVAFTGTIEFAWMNLGDN